MKTPYFEFRAEKLKENYKEFEKLCSEHLKDFRIAYSVKTNTSDAVIETLIELGSNFEVASLEEINKVGKKHMVFNGPCKTEEELKLAIKNKFLINIDSISEIDKINNILESKTHNVGLRISLDESKFGIPAEELKEAINYTKSKELNIICLHYHPGTQQNLDKYKEKLKRFSEVVEQVKKQLPDLKFIDIGGGFPDKIQLKNIKASLEDYIKTIKQNFEKFNISLILEPGRNLVADAFELITKVHAIKSNKSKTYAVLDVGINVLPRITLSTYEFSKIEEKKFKKLPSSPLKKEYILAGPLLFASDTMGKFIGILKESDLIKIGNVGAYCYNLAWEISYKKPQILIKEEY